MVKELILPHIFKGGKKLINKQFIWNISSSVLLLISLIIIMNFHNNIIELENKVEKWRSIAISEKEVPEINDLAKEFLEQLNEGRAKKYFSKEALKSFLAKEKESDNHVHDDDTSTGDQTIDILIATTQKEDLNKANSTIIYKLIYQSPFDEAEKGVIDQRVLTMGININWIKEDQKYKVNDFNVQLLKDNLDDYLSEKKGESDDQ